MKVLFFGQLREQLGVAELPLDIAPCSVRELRKTLSAKGENWESFLAADNLLVAVNQTICDQNYELSQDDEIAFFPPVTGG
ncbi:molybdopterin converting factor subunit 1 [Aliiglaciecola lipolytica]|uniref:Molybdopterin synthase sulfur carrier subunit n=1 Tax=Aliiglaciecola lipolytica E3 TaxID=1127673 RepID=K6Y8M1_9ALTE|nr:molybdopterin converting factor subunit 1 [Aliiglaciecola lipolytica]GAC14552.1 molybdopterin synthase sulfur carrier subunit [Aliiglaciecola lipolytica E3]